MQQDSHWKLDEKKTNAVKIGGGRPQIRCHCPISNLFPNANANGRSYNSDEKGNTNYGNLSHK